MEPVRIIGVGNSWRGDDAAGILAVRRLEDLRSDSVDVSEVQSVGPEVLDLFEDVSLAILIDAVQSGRKVGTVHCVQYPLQAIDPVHVSPSTHGFHLLDMLELGRVLNRLPRMVRLYGVEAGCLTRGFGISPEVERGIETVTALIREGLRNSIHPRDVP